MFPSLAAFHKFPTRVDGMVPKPRQKAAGRLSFSLLTEGLIIECHHTALTTAVAASGINMLNAPGAPIAFPDIMPYAMPDLALLRSLKSMAIEGLIGAGDLHALNSYLESLSLGRLVFEHYADEVRTLGADRAAILYQRPLTGQWQQACRQAVLALAELELVMGTDMPEPYLQNHQVLNGLLNSAAEGFKPCIDANSNQLFMPPLPQQRRWPRQSVLQNCSVTIAGKVTNAFIRDASAGGLGLDHMPAVSRGTSLSVEMENGRRLTGAIVWSRNTAAGLKFSKPLLPSDPLIRG